MKKILFITLLGISATCFSQDIKLTVKEKNGNCYWLPKNNNTLNKPLKVNCKLLSYCKGKKLRILQIKLSNLGYDVNISGKIDEKTAEAFSNYLKNKKM